MPRIAKHIHRGADLGGLRCDLQMVAEQLLAGPVQRCQVGHVLRRFHRRAVVVHRLVGDGQFHNAPTLWLLRPAWVK